MHNQIAELQARHDALEAEILAHHEGVTRRAAVVEEKSRQWAASVEVRRGEVDAALAALDREEQELRKATGEYGGTRDQGNRLFREIPAERRRLGECRVMIDAERPPAKVYLNDTEHQGPIHRRREQSALRLRIIGLQRPDLVEAIAAFKSNSNPHGNYSDGEVVALLIGGGA